MIKFKSLNQSKQFIKILKKKKLSTKYFIIYFTKNLNNGEKNTNKYLNISFVMKKNIGGAVKRNKIKRKLKAAVIKIIKEELPIDLNYTYIIFGRNDVYKDKFPLIFSEINNVFKKIKVGNHKGYYRVVLELDGFYRYKMQKIKDGYLFKLK